LHAFLWIFGDHFLKISSNSDVVMLEAFVQLAFKKMRFEICFEAKRKKTAVSAKSAGTTFQRSKM